MRKELEGVAPAEIDVLIGEEETQRLLDGKSWSDEHMRQPAVEVTSSWGAGAFRGDVRLGFRLGADDSLAGGDERFGEVAWS